MYDTLNELMQLDEKIKELNIKKGKNPSTLVNLRKSLSDKEDELKTKEFSIDSEEQKKEKLRSQVEDETIKLQKSEEKSAKVKNSKEYQAVLKEINNLKKSIGNIERQISVINENLSGIISEKEKIILDFDTAEKDYRSALVNFKDEISLMEREIAEYDSRRKEIIQSLPQDLVPKYHRLHKNKGGIAISLLNKNRCNVCNVMIPPQLLNQVLRKEEINFCPQCQRILIFITEVQ